MTGTERHYAGEGSSEYHEKKRAIPDQAIPWVARLRAEKLQPYIESSATVFEFGAGYGWNLLKLQCIRKIAFDIAVLPRTDPSIEWVRDPGELPEAFADVVICHHALEHVIEPAQALALLRRLLKPGGRLLLFVPFEKERRYREFDLSEPNHHLFSWNAQTLGNLATECDFKIQEISIGKFGYDRFATKIAVKFRVGEPGFRFVRGLVHTFKPAAEVRLVATK